MKKVLQFAGIISLALAVVAFILMLATPAVVYTSGSNSTFFAGALAVFGGKLDTAQKLVLLTTKDAALAVMGLLAWIFTLVGMIIVLLGVILPLLKINALEKFSIFFDLAALVLFVVGGVFMFIVLPSFLSAQGINNVPDGFAIGAGWVIGGILLIAAGVFAILPACAALLSKKK